MTTQTRDGFVQRITVDRPQNTGGPVVYDALVSEHLEGGGPQTHVVVKHRTMRRIVELAFERRAHVTISFETVGHTNLLTQIAVS